MKNEVKTKYFKGRIFCVLDDDGAYLKIEERKPVFYKLADLKDVIRYSNGKIDFEASTGKFWTLAKTILFNYKPLARHDACCVLKEMDDMFVTYLLAKMEKAK